jgi:hypothetical protein
MHRSHFHEPRFHREFQFEIEFAGENSLEEAQRTRCDYHEKTYYQLSDNDVGLLPVCHHDNKASILNYEPCMPRFIKSTLFFDESTRPGVRGGSQQIQLNGASTQSISLYLNDNKGSRNHSFSIRYGNMFYRFRNITGYVEIRFAAKVTGVFPVNGIPQIYLNVPVILYRPEQKVISATDQATGSMSINHSYICYDTCLLVPEGQWIHNVNVVLRRNVAVSRFFTVMPVIVRKEDREYGVANVGSGDQYLPYNPAQDPEINPATESIIQHKEWFLQKL